MKTEGMEPSRNPNRIRSPRVAIYGTVLILDDTYARKITLDGIIQNHCGWHGL